MKDTHTHTHTNTHTRTRTPPVLPHLLQELPICQLLVNGGAFVKVVQLHFAGKVLAQDLCHNVSIRNVSAHIPHLHRELQGLQPSPNLAWQRTHNDDKSDRCVERFLCCVLCAVCCVLCAGKMSQGKGWSQSDEEGLGLLCCCLICFCLLLWVCVVAKGDGQMGENVHFRKHRSRSAPSFSLSLSLSFWKAMFAASRLMRVTVTARRLASQVCCAVGVCVRVLCLCCVVFVVFVLLCLLLHAVVLCLCFARFTS